VFDKLKPPAQHRERYRVDLERALDQFAAYKEQHSPERVQARRDLVEQMEQLRQMNAAYVAMGGRDPERLQKTLDRSIFRHDLSDYPPPL
jgi:hypothetical protein